MLRLFALLGLAAAAAAQPTISNAAANMLSHGCVRIEFESSVTSFDPRVKFDLVDPPVAGSTIKKGINTGGGSTALGKSFCGLAPGTTYYASPCATASSLEGCLGSAISFTTPATPSDRFARPNEPLVSPTPAFPTSFATDYLVDAGNNCNNATVGLQGRIDSAVAIAGSGNIRIRIPGGARCIAPSAGAYLLKPRSAGGTGWIVITTDPADFNGPPGGVRLTSAWPVSQMAVISDNNTNATTGGAFNTVSGGPSKFWLANLYITHEVPSSSYKTITDAIGGVYTIAGHGYSDNQILQIWDEASGAYIRNAKLAGVTTNTFTISGSTANSGAIGAGARVTATATVYHSLINLQLSHAITNLVVDRCYFKGRNVPTGVYMAIASRTQNPVWIVNNSFEELLSWRGLDPTTQAVTSGQDNTTPTSIDLSYANQSVIENNYFDSPGITIFVTEVGGVDLHQDILFRRNTIHWPTKYLSGTADWDGLHHVFRQPFELKRGRRVRVTGNKITQFYNGSFTGGTASAFVLTPRPKTVNGNGSGNGIVDFILENNFVSNGPGFLGISGNSVDIFSGDTEPTKRLLVRNNLVTNINGRLWSPTISTTGPGTYLAGGHTFYLSQLQDTVIERNTIWNPHGTAPTMWAMFYDRQSGLRFRNNLIGINTSAPFTWGDDSTGAAMLPARVTSGTIYNQWTAGFRTSVPDTAGDAQIAGNVFVTGVQSVSNPDYAGAGLAESTCSSASGSNWNFGVSTRNMCAPGATANARFDWVSFFDRSSGNYRLKSSSPASSGAATKLTTNGLDAGADIDELEAELGKVKNFRVAPGQTSATVMYTAPDEVACTVEYGESSVFGSGTPISDGGGARPRAVGLSGLTPNTLYYARALCAVEQPQLSFRTDN